MIDLRQFCAELGIDETAARAALESSDNRSQQPWYVRAFLALGAWITAIAIIVFFGFLIALILDNGDAFEGLLAGLGVLCFAIGLAMLARRADGEFRTSFATALAAAGTAMAAGGIGFAAETTWAAAITSAVLSGVVVAAAPGLILQLLASGLAVALVAIALIADEVPYHLDIAAIALVAGVLLWCRPPRVELRPTAFALLLMAPGLAILDRLQSWSDAPAGGWGATAIHIALFAWLVSILWRRLTERHARVELAVFAVAAAAVCLLLPPGGSGALVILTLAYVLGSRPLALMGALLQAYFFWQFYYDLAISLLNKSILLTAVGLVILACWWLVAGRKSARAGP